MGDRARCVQSGVKKEIGIIGEGNIGLLRIVGWI